MKTYLCGGINGLSDADCRDWREYVKERLLVSTLDPMRRDFRGREDQYWREIVAYDLEDIDTCECVLVNATRPSWGTAMEVFYAHQSEKVVIAWVGQYGQQYGLSPWLRYHCEELHESLDDAIASINARVSRSCGQA
jgi:nucleoside 2-deoxyribosyltransferase